MNTLDNDYRYKWHILCAVTIGGFLSTLDMSIVNLILPTLENTLNTEFAMVQWVVVSYLLTITALILIMGRLGDLMGKKKVYLSGFILFTLGSVLCGLAPTIRWLIAFRVVQGIGGTMILALGFAVATQAFPHKERGKAMGILASLVSAGIVAGPLIGGFILKYLSWSWVFFVNLPVGLSGIAMVIKYIPDTKKEQSQTFDYSGAVTMFACMVSLLIALTLGQKTGFDNSSVPVLLILSLVFGICFILIEFRAKSPMIDLTIFHNIYLSANLVATFTFYFAINGVFVMLPFYIQNILQYQPDQMGMLFAVMSVIMVLISPFAGMLSDRFKTETILLVSLCLMMVNYTCLIKYIAIDTTLTQCILGMALLGAGMGLFMSPNHSAIMGSVSKQHLGIASSLLILSRTLGMIAGVSVLGALWAWRVGYHSNGVFTGGISNAPVESRITGLQDIFIFAVIITAISFLFMTFGVIHEWRKKHSPLCTDMKRTTSH